MKHSTIKILLIIGTVSFYSIFAKAQVTNFQVYSLFVINIAKYSSWPEASDEFKVVIYGKSPAYDELTKYATRGINGKKASIVRVNSVAEIGEPHIVYLSSESSKYLGDILALIKDKPIMVVTEQGGLYKKGAGFSFFINDQKNLRFDINLTDLEKRGIKVAKNLSGMAHEVL